MLQEDQEKLKELHKSGLSDRSIAKELNVHHRTIAYNLNKLGLKTNNPRKLKIDMVDEFNGICSKCKEIKPLEEFKKQRIDKKYEYRLTYCNDCRKKQIQENLRSSPKKFLKDRYNRLKRRCFKNGIYIDIEFEDLWNQFLFQEGKCFYTDEVMNITTPKGLKRDCLSIDKIIPELGYAKGNVVLCIWRINCIKSDATLEEMNDWMPKWCERAMKHLKENRIFNEFVIKNKEPKYRPGKLILLVGPSGAGKSTYCDKLVDVHGYYRSSIISSDEIRSQICLDFQDQSKNKQVFETLHSIVKSRIEGGLTTIVDATNIKTADRKSILNLVPEETYIEYHIIDRPLEEKLKTGGWRLKVENKGVGLIERHDRIFKSNLKDILAGDHDTRVRVIDMREE